MDSAPLVISINSILKFEKMRLCPTSPSSYIIFFHIKCLFHNKHITECSEFLQSRRVRSDHGVGQTELVTPWFRGDPPPLSRNTPREGDGWENSKFTIPN